MSTNVRTGSTLTLTEFGGRSATYPDAAESNDFLVKIELANVITSSQVAGFEEFSPILDARIFNISTRINGNPTTGRDASGNVSVQNPSFRVPSAVMSTDLLKALTLGETATITIVRLGNYAGAQSEKMYEYTLEECVIEEIEDHGDDYVWVSVKPTIISKKSFQRNGEGGLEGNGDFKYNIATNVTE